MANNPLLFNAALSGAFGGINTSRALSSDNAADYLTARNSAVTFAVAIDAAIPTDGTLTQQEADLMFSICQQVLNAKGSAGFSATSVAAIVAAYNLVALALEPVPAGSGSTPLTAAMYVDPATPVALADQDGSAISPFALIQAAIDALPSAGGTVLLTPGVYPAEDIQVVTPAKISLVGLTYMGGECDLGAVGVTTNATVSVENVSSLKEFLLLAPGHSVISVNNVTVENACGTGSIDAKFSTFNATVDTQDGINGVDTTFTDITSGTNANVFLKGGFLPDTSIGSGQVGLTDCDIGGNILAGSISLKGCTTGGLTVLTAGAGLIEIVESNLSGVQDPGALSATNLNIDTPSYQSIPEPDVVSVTNLTITDIQQPDTLIPTFTQKDDFEFLGVADGAAVPTAGLAFLTGSGGWNAIASLAAGSFVTSVYSTVADEDKAGVLGIRTAAATNNAIAGIQKAAMLSGSQFIRAEKLRFLTAYVRLPIITTMRAWFGFASDSLSVTPTSAIYFVYDSTVSPNWLGVTRSGGVESQFDTGVPVVAATWYKLKMVRPNLAANVDFYVNNAHKTHANAHVPGGTAGVNLCFMAKTLTGAAARGYDIDFEASQASLIR